MPTKRNGTYNLPDEERKNKKPTFLYTAKDVENDEVNDTKKAICERIILSQTVNSGEQLWVSCAKYGIGSAVFQKWLNMPGMEQYKEDMAMARHRLSKINPHNLSSQCITAMSKIIEDPTEVVVVRKESSDGKVVTETRTKKNKELQISTAKFIVERTSPDYSLALKQQNIAGAIELIRMASTFHKTTPELAIILRAMLVEFLNGKGVAVSELDLSSPNLDEAIEAQFTKGKDDTIKKQEDDDNFFDV